LEGGDQCALVVVRVDLADRLESDDALGEFWEWFEHDAISINSRQASNCPAVELARR
jgi:hypothetical protein